MKISRCQITVDRPDRNFSDFLDRYNLESIALSPLKLSPGLMLLSNTKIPNSLVVTIWSLRSVPICMTLLMFVFNSGSLRSPQANLHFWFDTLALLGIVGIIAYWHRLDRLRWNASFVAYLYIFIVLILRNPYGILTAIPGSKLTVVDWTSIFKSLSVYGGIFALGMVVEFVIFHLRQLKQWAWWAAMTISILYVASIIFFFSGTLGIWSLLDPDTKQSFRDSLRQIERGKG